MKGLQIVASLLLLAAFCKADDAEENDKRILQLSKECADEQGLENEKIEEIPRKLCSGESLDKELGCHMACLYKKLNVLKGDEVNEHELKHSIFTSMKNRNFEEELMSRLDICKPEFSTISDECDKAAVFSKCMIGGSTMCLPPVE